MRISDWSSDVCSSDRPDVAKALPSWQGKIIVDVTNAYGVSDEELGGQPSAHVVARAFAGGRLVKGFNHLAAAVLDQDPAVHGGKRSEEHTSELQSLMRISYAVFCLKKKKKKHK